MVVELIRFDGIHLVFPETRLHQVPVQVEREPKRSFFVGEFINLQLICPIKQPGNGSPISVNSTFRKQLLAAIGIKWTISGLESAKEYDHLTTEKDNLVVNPVLSRVVEDYPLRNDPYFSDNTNCYCIPLQVQLLDIPRNCDKAQLSLCVRPSNNAPRWLSSPSSPTLPDISSDEKDHGRHFIGKTVTHILNIVHPPSLVFQQKNIGNKLLLLLKVRNTSCYCMNLEDCSIVPESCPKLSSNQTCSRVERFQKGVCVAHGNLVKLVQGDHKLFPTSLLPAECLSLTFVLNLSHCLNDFLKDDVILESHLKWSICSKKHKISLSSITTSYRLPNLRIKQGFFVMSATCEEDQLTRGKSFTVMYTINNNLHDFLSVRLYWNPACTDTSKEAARNLESLQLGLVCQDPSVQLGPCKFGETLQAKVCFTATRKGLFEVCQHMKINLRYLIPGFDNTSTTNNPVIQQSTAISNDSPVHAPRSGSGSSWNDTHSGCFESSQFSLASKSYSFGDLGQQKGSDQLVYKQKRFTPSDLQKRDTDMDSTIAAFKYDQLLLNPSNFIKNSCVVWVQ